MKMATILNKFHIFSKVDSKLKRSIKLFHVFDQGNSAFFISATDIVHGLCLSYSSNYYSILYSSEPKVITELCNKNIKQFFIGSSYILAINNANQVFGWVLKKSGNFLTRNRFKRFEYLRSSIFHFENENIVKISVGDKHCLILTSQGNVYGWGSNEYGQVGCGRK